MGWSKIWSCVTRRKNIAVISDKDTKLKRCLNTCDVTLFGVSVMAGTGIYVLSGTVVRHVAGPGALLSFLLAALAALLPALCYAELGARIPAAGGSYSYTYVALGEFSAFLIGWNDIVDYILDVASVSIALSGTVDALTANAISNWTVAHIAIHDYTWLNPSPDFLASGLILLLMIVVGAGVTLSSVISNLLAAINIAVLMFIIIAGFTKADLSNWTNTEHGGFLPHGFWGVLVGAGPCLFAFLGFEGIGSTAEEIANPSKTIPRASIISISMVAVLYMLAIATLTLMVPYSDVVISSPFPSAFAQVGMNWALYISASGSLVGMLGALLGDLYAMPRLIYAIAQDGLIFQCLGHINKRTQTPLVAGILSSFLASCVALVVNMETMIGFFSIGTLMSFTAVNLCIIVLRYRHEEDTALTHTEECGDKAFLMPTKMTLKPKFQKMPLFAKYKSEWVVKCLILMMTIFMVASSLCLVFGSPSSNITIKWTSTGAAILFAVGAVVCVICLCMFEQNLNFDTFKVPGVPFLPAFSIYVNVFLIARLRWVAWVRLAVWTALGLLVYFIYGMSHSKEGKEATPLSSLPHEAKWYGTEPCLTATSSFTEKRYTSDTDPNEKMRLNTR